jgi:tripartite-type tricarboxylate transporter receptor subunit TctC
MNMRAGIKTQHVPYKGAGPALLDLIAGQVQIFINNPLTVIPHIKSGRVRAIAVTGPARLAGIAPGPHLH